MNKATLLYKHEKNNWSVELMSDGTLWVCGYFKNKINHLHHINALIPLEYLDFVPKYVVKMIAGAQTEWRGHCSN